MQQKIQIHLTLPMLKRMELVAASVSEALAELMNFDEDRSLEVSTALIEACLNSFEHSKGDDSKIDLTFFAEDGQLRIVIHDRGVGFEPENVEVPSIEEQLKPGARQRGWGLEVMKGMMDVVEIQSDKNGTTVSMIKNNG